MFTEANGDRPNAANEVMAMMSGNQLSINVSFISTKGGALKYARETMFTTANGDRPNAANVVVVMTDGRSNSYSYTATEVNF